MASKPPFGVWLANASERLHEAGIKSARLDSLLLAENILQKNREHLLAHQDVLLELPHVQLLNKLLVRRLKHEPIAYIRGRVEFFGREFLVNKNALIPRPDSEDLIGLLKNLPAKKHLIADIGTGSGCLAITAKLEQPYSEVIAVDIDSQCLSLARQNAKKHGVQMKFLEGNLLLPLTRARYPLSVILANLPYVPAELMANPGLKYEPKIALNGKGIDGMDTYRRFWRQLQRLEPKPRFIISESLKIQHTTMRKLAKKSGYRQVNSLNLSQLFELEDL